MCGRCARAGCSRASGCRRERCPIRAGRRGRMMRSQTVETRRHSEADGPRWREARTTWMRLATVCV